MFEKYLCIVKISHAPSNNKGKSFNMGLSVNRSPLLKLLIILPAPFLPALASVDCRRNTARRGSAGSLTFSLIVKVHIFLHNKVSPK